MQDDIDERERERASWVPPSHHYSCCYTSSVRLQNWISRPKMHFSGASRPIQFILHFPFLRQTESELRDQRAKRKFELQFFIFAIIKWRIPNKYFHPLPFKNTRPFDNHSEKRSWNLRERTRDIFEHTLEGSRILTSMRTSMDPGASANNPILYKQLSSHKKIISRFSLILGIQGHIFRTKRTILPARLHERLPEK